MVALELLIFRFSPKRKANLQLSRKQLYIASQIIAGNLVQCYPGGMKPLTISDAETIVLRLQDEIRRHRETHPGRPTQTLAKVSPQPNDLVSR